ncbi:sarcosine oxidase subunit alpha family protein [Saccharopolyspora rosea]|uniref:Glycine cleavage T C-terminal barrel domain-containing protein n=1 Tax=Saccharopolyspora rosea TaxID=524884 RepID=A0ABW3FZ28_9PSEU
MTRLDSGGRIDRTRTLRFTLDGIEFTGHPGDTLASALLASGRIEVGPSIHRDRPRGIVTADRTEPNAHVQVLNGRPEPMVPATELELFDGLQAASLSSVGWLGNAPGDTVHDKKYAHADVAVVGAGPTGIAAALAAGRGGARVVLVDRGRELGGALLDGAEHIDGRPATAWISRAVREFVELPEVRVLTRATAVSHHDHGHLLVAEHRGNRRRLWHVRARRVVLATGARERPVVFADNDRPGVMLASAVRSYLNRYGVLPGRRAVVFTTSDSAYRAVADLAAAGARVVAVVDTRPNPPERLRAQAREAGARLYTGSAVVGTSGQRRVRSVRVAPVDDAGLLAGPAEELDCDLLAVCGGWSPVLDLFSQAGGTLRWDQVVAGFVPEQGAGLPRVVGAARGTYDLAGCLAQGLAAGAEASTAAGFRVASPPVPPVSGDRPAAQPRPLWLVPAEDGDPQRWHDHFVDLQRDSTVADVWRSVERSPTVGSDRGRTSGVGAIGLVADALAADAGTTTSRPCTPVSFALLAGRDRGELHDPVRTTPMHSWHVAHGAEFEDVGQWRRARCYPRPGEDVDAAVHRECLAAREGVAVVDVSTLGKIEVVGPDAPEFLDRICTSALAELAVGRCRYGVLCTPDGAVFDDGVALRLAEDRYLMSTTTGNAAAVLEWLEEWLRTEWSHLAVHCTPVTEQWAGLAVVGPDSREVIARVAPELDVSAEAFRFMEFRETVLASGIPARISRISFSGELAFEVDVATWYGLAVWEAVHEAGQDFGITPYGTETVRVLRAEKGFVVIGQDTDGTVTPLDLGMDRVVSRRADFVGKRALARPDAAREGRKQLVGLLPVDPGERLPEGAPLVEPEVAREPPVPTLGHVTSSYRSAALGRTFALALVADGRRRVGEVLHAPVSGRSIPVRVTGPVFYDEEGARRDGRQPR